MARAAASGSAIALGLAACLAAALIAFVWVPSDIDSGITEQARRQTRLGDAFAPALAAGIIGLGGALVLIFDSRRGVHGGLTLRNLRYIGTVCAIFFIAVGLMGWAGPAAVALLGPEGGEYRLLRDTPPWKYIGFAAGGTWLVCMMICFTEGRFRLRSLVIALVAVAAMVGLFDLPFRDLLLPPNGDI